MVGGAGQQLRAGSSKRAKQIPRWVGGRLRGLVDPIRWEGGHHVREHVDVHVAPYC